MSACLRCGTEIVNRRSDALYCSKSCSVAVGNARYWATEKAKKVRANYYRTESGKASRDRYLHSKKNLEGQAIRTRKWRGRYPEKWEAHKAVKRALETGELTKPAACRDCGAEGLRLDGHHPDYSRQLDVKWVCRRCHFVRHGVLEANLAET